MFTKNHIKKVAIRILIINVAFFIIKSTIDHDDMGLLSGTSLFYYFSAFFLFMWAWETNDWLIRRSVHENGTSGLEFSQYPKIIGLNLLLILPVTALIYSVAIYVFDNFCGLPYDEKGLTFRIDFFRAALLGFTVVISNLFYYSIKQKKVLEQRMNELQKDVMTSKYKSLKNQISPHFLFNSLNTLTSLMYEDRDLASDFVTRLASSYRYILDNKEEDVVPLEKELNFLDSFIFMMNVRHSDAIAIQTDIGINPKEFFIPTLALQMLVENAMKHNYFSKEKPMRITVYNVGKIALVVENTLRKRKLETESTRLGIKNIQNRYSFYTNQEVTVESDGKHFKVTMPLLYAKAIKSQILFVS